MIEMIVLIAVNGRNDVIGTISYKAEADGHAHIRGMAVLPTAQECGVAKMLIDRVQSELRTADCHFMTLDTTRPLQRAIRFYEKNGFQATGEVKQFYGMDLLCYKKEPFQSH